MGASNEKKRKWQFPENLTAMVIFHDTDFFVYFEILFFALILHGNFQPFLVEWFRLLQPGLMGCPDTDQVREFCLLPSIGKAV